MGREGFFLIYSRGTEAPSPPCSFMCIQQECDLVWRSMRSCLLRVILKTVMPRENSWGF